VTNHNTVVAIALAMVFINKIPLYGFHYWLIKAHSYCTTWGRIILARIILKVGVLGLMYLYQIRYICLTYIKYFLYVGICISRVNILFLTDIKIIIAQTRVTHISFLGVRLLLNRNLSIKLSIVFRFIHGAVRSIMFAFGEMLAIFSKSRNMMLLKSIYVISIIFIGVILINNSFPITPYIWCELWIFIIMSSCINSVRCAIIVIIMVLSCNILFFQWVVIIKHQYLAVISDLKYTYLIKYIVITIMLFFIMLK